MDPVAAFLLGLIMGALSLVVLALILKDKLK